MDHLSPSDITAMFLGLGTLLAAARVFGEAAKWFRQPAVLGEILAGILLGPTVLGRLAPGVTEFLFRQTNEIKVAYHGLTTLAVVLFMLVGGMEVDLSTIWRQGKSAFAVSVAGIVFPFSVGLLTAWLLPGVLDRKPETDPWVFALFFATALSISALPVIVKTLMDLNLYRTDLGMVVVAAAVFDDLVGWLIFAVVLARIDVGGHGMGFGYTIVLTLAYAATMLTLGRWLFHRILPWVQAYTSWPGGVLGLALSLALLGAAFTEWIGIHAIFGAFLVGVAIGDSSHLREQTRSIISQFVSFIFAPLFFASIGLRIDFIAHFDLLMVLIVLVVAMIGKIVGCGLGARFAGMQKREAWAVGFGMNARGAMEIILGSLAFQYGLIGERMLVALILMALVTSMLSGPGMQRLLRRKTPKRFTDYLSAKHFITSLAASDRREAITELVRTIAPGGGAPGPPGSPDAPGTPGAPGISALLGPVLAREDIMPTGIGGGLAIPHARIDGLAAPVVAVGLSSRGIDFDAPDGEPATLIFLLLTPRDDDGAQLEILADIARTFRQPALRENASKVASFTQFLAMLRTEKPPDDNKPGRTPGRSTMPPPNPSA